MLRKASPLEASQDGIEGVRRVLFGDGMDQSAKFAHEPAAEAGGAVIVALDEGDPFADRMCEAAWTRRYRVLYSMKNDNQP